MEALVLFRKACNGDKGAFGQLVSLVENNGREALGLLEQIELAKGNTFTVGIVGGPGVGKSTLIGSLLGVIAKDGRRIAVVSIDPSSPFTGGAVLGDRIRMQVHSNLPGVFVRSMGTRGYEGGLSACTAEIIELLCALRFDVVIVETAGVGQVDLGIADVADTVVVTLVPGWGDSIQVAKAGLMEIGDIYVVNKSDHEGAFAAVRDIELMLDSRQITGRKAKVLQTSATSGVGIKELWEEIVAHQGYLSSSGQGIKRRICRLSTIIKRSVFDQLASKWNGNQIYDLATEVVNARLRISEAIKKAVDGINEVS